MVAAGHAFASPVEAMTALATCLGALTIENPDGGDDLEPDIYIGDEGAYDAVDCCPTPYLKFESQGEPPMLDNPALDGKCLDLQTRIKITFGTCFKLLTKNGTTITDEARLAYTLAIVESRWDALLRLKCCRTDQDIPVKIYFDGTDVLPSDGKCAGWVINVRVPVKLCGPCPTIESASS